MIVNKISMSSATTRLSSVQKPVWSCKTPLSLNSKSKIDVHKRIVDYKKIFHALVKLKGAIAALS
jgi:hypothetical protein